MIRKRRDLHLVLGFGNYRRISRASNYVPQHVSRVLRGKTGASLDAAAAIAEAAGVTLDELWFFIQQARKLA